MFRIGTVKVPSGCAATLLALGLSAGHSALAQQDVHVPSRAERADAQPATGSITGIVTDADGKLLPHANVTLSIAAAPARETLSDDEGRFRFEHVPAENFTLTVNAAGFGADTVSGVEQAGQAYDAQAIVLRPAAAAQVEAVTREQLLDMQVKEQEQQRFLGAIPNFYVTYEWHAQPLTAKKKFELAWKTSIDPVNVVIDGAIAGINQAVNALPGYGQGARGYAKRFGAAEGDLVVGTFVGGAIVPALLHQDPRFFYKADGTLMQRALYALSTAVICRGDNGKWQPNYSSVIGDVAAGAATNLYYPSTDRNGVKLIFENGLLNAGLDGVGNLLQELFYARFTYVKGKNAAKH